MNDQRAEAVEEEDGVQEVGGRRRQRAAIIEMANG